jgi:serine/threonine-protein kinase RIM15
MIKSTKNANQDTPIVAITSSESPEVTERGTLFSSVLVKPVEKAGVFDVLKKLGFAVTAAKTKNESSGVAEEHVAADSEG